MRGEHVDGWLAAHPNNPLSCLVTKAPMYSDLESWNPRSELKYVEALICSQGSRCSRSYLVDQRLDCKSWRLVRIRIERLLSIGLQLLRGFTLFWLFPASLLVGLVSIQNISLFWPSLVCVSYILLEQGGNSFLVGENISDIIHGLNRSCPRSLWHCLRFSFRWFF